MGFQGGWTAKAGKELHGKPEVLRWKSEAGVRDVGSCRELQSLRLKELGFKETGDIGNVRWHGTAGELSIGGIWSVCVWGNGSHSGSVPGPVPPW